MSIYGIIAEYNPFHNGHLFQINQIKQIDPSAKIIVVMTGNFTQRGSLAILDKWQRAELAVNNGANLILELPVVFSLQSAQYFAAGSIDLLNNLKIIDHLVFGVEENFNLSVFSTLAQATNSSKHYNALLKNNLASGMSYASATANAITSYCDISPDTIRQSNNILALEYLKHLYKINSNISPLPVQRICVNHNDNIFSGSFASASAIRNELLTTMPRFNILKRVIPFQVFDLIFKQYLNNCLPKQETLQSYIISQIYSSGINNMRDINGMDEGLEYLILKSLKNNPGAAMSYLSLELSNKRYTRSRINRLLCSILLNIKRETVNRLSSAGPLYIRPLAFDNIGQKLLHNIKTISHLPIITKVSKVLNSQKSNNDCRNNLETMLSFDLHASDIYYLMCKNIIMYKNDLIQHPFFIAKNNF